jgi:hypothetical protein
MSCREGAKLELVVVTLPALGRVHHHRIHPPYTPATQFVSILKTCIYIVRSRNINTTVTRRRINSTLHLQRQSNQHEHLELIAPPPREETWKFGAREVGRRSARLLHVAMAIGEDIYCTVSISRLCMIPILRLISLQLVMSDTYLPVRVGKDYDMFWGTNV